MGVGRARVLRSDADKVHWKTYLNDVVANEKSEHGWHEWQVSMPVARQPDPAAQALGRSGLGAANPAERRACRCSGVAPPQIPYFRSFTKAGETPPQLALIDMAKVTRTNPAAPVPRLYLAEELVREGRRDLAKAIMLPVLL